MEIIEATEEHVKGIIELWKNLMDYHKVLNPFHDRREDAHLSWVKYLRNHMGSEEARVLVALDQGGAIGYVIGNIKEGPPIFQANKFGFISDMHIMANYRRKGIGENMLTDMLGWYKFLGIERIELRVEPTNEIGMAFWAKQGFKEHVRTLYLKT